MEGYVDYFERAELRSYKQLLKLKYSHLRRSGVYGWYFKKPPPYVPRKGCTYIDTGWWPSRTRWWLLYVGKATDLSYRILDMHFDGEYWMGKSLSSLRLTLGCLLCGELGISLRRHPDPVKDYTFGSKGDKKLSDWMKKHARVAYVRTEHIEELERKAIDYYTLLLNTERNTHYFLAPLGQLKKDFRDCAALVGAKRKHKRKVRKAYKKFVKKCKALGIKK